MRRWRIAIDLLDAGDLDLDTDGMIEMVSDVLAGNRTGLPESITPGKIDALQLPEFPVVDL